MVSNFDEPVFNDDDQQVEPEPQPIPKPEPEKPLAPIAISQDGKYVSTNMAEEYRISRFMFESGMIPKGFKNITEVMAGRNYARSFGLNPDTSLRLIGMVNGSPSLHSEGPKAVVQASGELEYMDEKWLTKGYEEICLANKNLHEQAWAAWCRVKRKNGTTLERAFTLDDAKQAGLYPAVFRDGKPNPEGPWSAYTKRMLQMRTRAWALKDLFADVLTGAAIAEYDHHTTFDDQSREVKETVNPVSTADELNDILGGKK